MEKRGQEMVPSAVIPPRQDGPPPPPPPVSGALPARGFESANWPVKMPKVLRVVRQGKRPARLFIDGEPLDCATVDGFTVTTRKGELPSVTVTLVGYRVEAVDDLDDGDGGA